ncbi:hypothetical protein [Fimbriiglobus ruber]|uniref:hypothetical protein n=1 Tax=Fimbriiglobus ruber TaxID=1908690 RepID=UPI00117AB9EA|nr:hypothetical protein [Fimbriiglobus ruber]
MTKEEWDECNDASRLLAIFSELAVASGEYPPSKGQLAICRRFFTPARKFRLFAIACCRQLSPFLAIPYARDAVDMAERYVDGQETMESLIDMHEFAEQTFATVLNESEPSSPMTLSLAMILNTLWAEISRHYGNIEGADYIPLNFVSEVISQQCSDIYKSPEETSQSSTTGNRYLVGLVRCIFGNPFSPFNLDRANLTSAVSSFARQMYSTKDFSPMPLLADALQEAGCTDENVLRHCRGSGPHTKGCFVVDVILEKG